MTFRVKVRTRLDVTSDARQVQAILQVAQACGSAAGMSAVVEGSTLRSIQCSLSRGFGIAAQ